MRYALRAVPKDSPARIGTPLDRAHAIMSSTSDAASAASAALRAAQAPLKESYSANPSSAVVTLKSTSKVDDSAGVSCSLSVGKAIKQAGLHKLAGGDESLEQL